VSGTDLQTTTLERKYPPKVYCHFQTEEATGRPPARCIGDDFHSPAKPAQYIALRLTPMQEFYQQRIPGVVRWRNFLQWLVFLCSTASVALAYFQFTTYVAIISSLAGAITSWAEFTDASRKVQRYTTAVRGLKNINAWWESLTAVELWSKRPWRMCSTSYCPRSPF